MVTMFVRHKINDYGNWKQVYDEITPMRQEMGVTGASVHRDAHDADVVIITHQFDDVDAATAFANSEDLKAAMMDAGVAGPPDFWFGEDIEHTSV